MWWGYTKHLLGPQNLYSAPRRIELSPRCDKADFFPSATALQLVSSLLQFLSETFQTYTILFPCQIVFFFSYTMVCELTTLIQLTKF